MAVTWTETQQRKNMIVLKAVVTIADVDSACTWTGSGYVERIQVTWGGTTPDNSCTITLVDANSLDASNGKLAAVDGTGADLDFLTSDLHVPIYGALTIGETGFGTPSSSATVYIYIAQI